MAGSTGGPLQALTRESTIKPLMSALTFVCIGGQGAGCFCCWLRAGMARSRLDITTLGVTTPWDWYSGAPGNCRGKRDKHGSFWAGVCLLLGEAVRRGSHGVPRQVFNCFKAGVQRSVAEVGKKTGLLFKYNCLARLYSDIICL